MQNQFTVDAVLTKKDVLRYTPVGIEVQEIQLSHQSQQHEGEGSRLVAFELFAVAFGGLAKQLAAVNEQSLLRLTGFLARRWRTGTTLALHITAFELLKTD